MNIFKKQKYIYTEYQEIHIQRLNEEKIPYEIRTEIVALNYAKGGYLLWSFTADVIVFGGVIWFFFFS